MRNHSTRPTITDASATKMEKPTAGAMTEEQARYTPAEFQWTGGHYLAQPFLIGIDK
jgi:hypothetical protein